MAWALAALWDDNARRWPRSAAGGAMGSSGFIALPCASCSGRCRLRDHAPASASSPVADSHPRVSRQAPSGAWRGRTKALDLQLLHFALTEPIEAFGLGPEACNGVPNFCNPRVSSRTSPSSRLLTTGYVPSKRFSAAAAASSRLSQATAEHHAKSIADKALSPSRAACLACEASPLGVEHRVSSRAKRPWHRSSPSVHRESQTVRRCGSLGRLVYPRRH